jgi:cell division protease FtsH
MVAALLEFERIDADQISDIMAGLPVRQPKPTQSKIPPAAGGSSTAGPAATPAPQPSAKTE